MKKRKNFAKRRTRSLEHIRFFNKSKISKLIRLRKQKLSLIDNTSKTLESEIKTRLISQLISGNIQLRKSDLQSLSLKQINMLAN